MRLRQVTVKQYRNYRMALTSVTLSDHEGHFECLNLF